MDGHSSSGSGTDGLTDTAISPAQIWQAQGAVQQLLWEGAGRRKIGPSSAVIAHCSLRCERSESQRRPCARKNHLHPPTTHRAPCLSQQACALQTRRPLHHFLPTPPIPTFHPSIPPPPQFHHRIHPERTRCRRSKQGQGPLIVAPDELQHQNLRAPRYRAGAW